MESKIIVNYSNQEVIHGKKGIFLAGPTPRDKDTISWRNDAIETLKKLGFDGVIFVPEYEGLQGREDYTDQALWEREALSEASTIVFWVPRELEKMPAFTTNVEFGYWINRNKIVYGRPDNARKIKYLDWLYDVDYMEKPYNNLDELLKISILIANEQYELRQNTTSLDKLIEKVLPDSSQFYEAIAKALTPVERDYIIKYLQNKTCLNCKNKTCEADIASRYTIDENNNQAGYNCLAWENNELVGKAKVFRMKDIEKM